MRFDGHIHIMTPDENPSPDSLKRLRGGGVSGGLIISYPPQSYQAGTIGFEARLSQLLQHCGICGEFYPFFWTDPLDDTVFAQLEAAANAGVRGFKVICDRFYPYEPVPMATFRRIAEMGYPLLFHSGILGDGKFSSLYNRPVFFECLFAIPKLRFALAHLGWPWCDEYLATFLMFQVRENLHDDSPHMFIDNTAGTPHIYRMEALTRLFDVCRARDRIFFGTDLLLEDYRSQRAAELMARDDGIYRELKLTESEIDAVYHNNLLAFIEG